MVLSLDSGSNGGFISQRAGEMRMEVLGQDLGLILRFTNGRGRSRGITGVFSHDEGEQSEK